LVRVMAKYKFLVGLLLISITLCVGYLFHYHHIHRYDPLIMRISASYGIDPVLVRALIYEESYFDANAHSAAGAVGLMQVTPIIIREWTRVTGQQQLIKAFPKAVQNFPKDHLSRMNNDELLNNPEINIHIGCWYLDQLMQRYAGWDDPLPVVLASYNAGPSHAMRWKERVAGRPQQITANKYIEQIDFPETRNYVVKVLDRYKKFKQNKNDINKVGWLLGKN
jgi:soluble lytic murein transglycosylase